jgi:membrane-associated phospholipid phosphatase
MILALPLALVLAVFAAYVSYFSLDLSITQELQETSNPLFRGLMIGVSWFGNSRHGIIITVLLTIVLLLMRLKIEAWTLLISSTVGEVVDFAIKIIVARPRPTVDLVSVYTHLNSKSFPSGHVFHYVALYGLLFYLAYVLMPRSIYRTILLVIFGSLVSLVGISRMYLGEHWASDVVGAYLFGTIWLFVVIDLYWHLKIRQLRLKSQEG